MSFTDDYDINEMDDSTPPSEEKTSSQSSNSGSSGYSNDRFALAFYKPKQKFDPKDPKTVGSAFQCELTQYDTYNSVFISMAKQINPQTQERGSKVFDWNNKDSVVKFKCGIVDVQQLLTILTYLEPEVGLFHKSQAGASTTLNASVMGKINHDNIRRLCELYEKGDDKNEPRKSGLNPRSITLTIKRGDTEYKMMFLPFEVIGLRVFFEEALRRMYAKPYVKKS